jgi:hypothetical protein
MITVTLSYGFCLFLSLCTQGISRGKIIARRRFPDLQEVSESEGNEKEKDMEREHRKAYQSSVLTDKRKGDSSSSLHDNKVVKVSRGDAVRPHIPHIPTTARSEPGNIDSAVNIDSKIRNSNSPHLVCDPVQPYVSGEISFANHDYPAGEVFSHDNPLKKEKPREKDREKGRDRERERDSDCRSAPRIPGKVRKSKRRMSFPRQPSAESLEFKIPVPTHLSESKMDTKEISPRRASRVTNGNSKGCVWTEDLDSRLGCESVLSC